MISLNIKLKHEANYYSSTVCGFEFKSCVVMRIKWILNDKSRTCRLRHIFSSVVWFIGAMGLYLQEYDTYYCFQMQTMNPNGLPFLKSAIRSQWPLTMLCFNDDIKQRLYYGSNSIMLWFSSIIISMHYSALCQASKESFHNISFVFSTNVNKKYR